MRCCNRQCIAQFFLSEPDRFNAILKRGRDLSHAVKYPGSLFNESNHAANKALQVVTAATATAAGTKTRRIPSWGLFAPPYPKITNAISEPSEKGATTHDSGCFCGLKDTNKRMILCDGPSCDLTGRWLHYGCVGLQEDPKVKKWYCPWCQVNKLTRAKKNFIIAKLEVSEEACKDVTKAALLDQLRIRTSVNLGLGRRVSPLSSEPIAIGNSEATDGPSSISG